MSRRVLATACLSLLIAGGASAEPALIAHARIDANSRNLAGQTAATLENGQPGNLLAGLGSGLDFAGGTTFVAMPDRGPNAKPYNDLVDNTTSYVPRFQTFAMTLAPSSGPGLLFSLTPQLLGTTLLSSPTPLHYGGSVPAINTDGRYYFSGRSDNFADGTSSLEPGNARLDPEGVRIAKDGKTVFVSDEYGPHVYQFDRLTGARLRVFTLPDMFGITHQSAQGDSVEVSTNTSGRVANKGMEGLALTPDGTTLVGIMQSPLLQDGGIKAPYVRIVTIDIASGRTHQYAYALTNIGTADKPKYTGISEIVAVDDHVFLVDERDGKGRGDGSAAVFKRLFRVDLSGAQDVSMIQGADALAEKAVPKTLAFDLVALFTAGGIAATDIPAKIEGVTLGPDVSLSGHTIHTLWIANDNDFLPTTEGADKATIDNPNDIYVIGFEDADLAGSAR